MSTKQFNCPNCNAQYNVVRVEAQHGRPEQEITCLSCGAPLSAYENGVALKYFRTKGRAKSLRRA